VSYFISGHIKRFIVIDDERYCIEYTDNYVIWFKNGKKHRECGPAYVNNNYMSWYKNGKLHREDGPAVEWYNGYKEWWFNGVVYEKESYYKMLKELKFGGNRERT
jgi:hypothetical protein